MTSELDSACTLTFGGRDTLAVPFAGKLANLYASTSNENVAQRSPSSNAQIALKDRHKNELAQRINMRRALEGVLERHGMLKFG